MTNKQSVTEPDSVNTEKKSWGSILFFATLIAVLVFFWWLLIYSGGVSVHHG
jgi:hypothetical protein